VEGKAAELKKELQRAVKAIVDEEEDGGVESTNRAMQCLCALRDLKLKPLGCSESLGIGNLSLGLFPPKEFLCPLSGELMNDPVVLSSGQVRLVFFDDFHLITTAQTLITGEIEVHGVQQLE